MNETAIKELKEALDKARNEITELKQKFNSDIVEMHNEIDYLKEQLMAQQGMLTDAIEYASKLEKQFKQLKKEIRSGNKESIH